MLIIFWPPASSPADVWCRRPSPPSCPWLGCSPCSAGSLIAHLKIQHPWEALLAVPLSASLNIALCPSKWYWCQYWVLLCSFQLLFLWVCRRQLNCKSMEARTEILEVEVASVWQVLSKHWWIWTTQSEHTTQSAPCLRLPNLDPPHKCCFYLHRKHITVSRLILARGAQVIFLYVSRWFPFSSPFSRGTDFLFKRLQEQ